MEEIVEAIHRRLPRNGRRIIDVQRRESYLLQVRTQHICRHMARHRKKLNARSIARVYKALGKINPYLPQVASVARARGRYVLAFHLCLFKAISFAFFLFFFQFKISPVINRSLIMCTYTTRQRKLNLTYHFCCTASLQRPPIAYGQGCAGPRHVSSDHS